MNNYNLTLTAEEIDDTLIKAKQFLDKPEGGASCKMDIPTRVIGYPINIIDNIPLSSEKKIECTFDYSFTYALK